MFTLTNPSAITFPRFNADNTVSALDASTFRSAIGAGTSSTTGTVTSVATGSGLTGGTITTTGTVSLATAYGDTVNPYASKTANFILAAPNGTAGVPTFRAVVAADIPTLNQNTTGNAATATTLQTARTINGVSFNGSANITVTASTPAALTAGTYLTSGGTFDGSTARTFAVDATTTNTASKVVARDASGNFAANIITHGAGSAAAPSITTAGDTNTGMFFPAADTIAFAEGGVESMRIDSSGNLGLGVTPSARLNVLSTASTTVPAIKIESSASLANNDILRFQINGLTNGMRMFQNASSNVVYSFEGGNVGVGTTSPGSKLDVYVTRTSSTNAVALTLSDNVTGAQTNGVYKAIRSSSNGGSSVSEIRFLETDGTNNNTGIAFATAFTAGSLAERFRIGPSGQLGIGGANYGTSGQVLVSQGSGAAPVWGSASSNTTTFGLYENASVISANYTIANGNNAISAGPITVNGGVTVTVPSGSTWTVT
jgi:hypothetical protein